MLLADGDCHLILVKSLISFILKSIDYCKSIAHEAHECCRKATGIELFKEKNITFLHV